jgi:O-antigen/teichoic acid export membrane protein
LIVVFALMPMLLVTELLYSCTAGLARWRAITFAILIPFEVPFVAIVGLYAVRHLTVGTAAAATIAGAVLAVIPCLPVLRMGRPIFRFSVAREGVSFGLKSWLGGLAQLANGRLDQLLMITAVSPTQLGLYAVATTLAGASTLVAGALAAPLMTRVAAGETRLMADAVRIMLVGTFLLDLALAAVTPALLPLLFGPEFSAAVPMAIVLLAANVPLSTTIVLSSGLQGDGAPLIPSIGEGIALVVTVVGLIVLLPPLEGLGAAIVSLAAYSSSFVFQLVVAQRRMRLPFSVFLVPRGSDAQWARAQLSNVVARLRPAE